MSHVVSLYRLPERGQLFAFEMPVGSEVLGCGVVEERPVLWVLEPLAERRKEVRRFLQMTNGLEIPVSKDGLSYIGSVVVHGSIDVHIWSRDTRP